ncbi:RsmB/NOP family class I SAM-dependent RNA methyltransferase [uncultured Tateyamaria sp.]|uniref:RsmB/NOP family class I SAM-dependent RNA methyltransferase n=1 Tax=uncultured Tateyamaria sp. TaxID=455651 RepID=UPI0026257642|nr:RsmB/NOP family class I SAM-dependent RNA methyltransferase [uncultured Tateyamaria sp.]
MTPGARVAAAIEIIDAIAGGQAAEQELTRWARNSRFAGSKDRAAVRDHVFDVLRNWRSDAVRGGGDTGRARMIGRLRDLGIDPSDMFTGQGHAPSVLTEVEQASRGIPETPGDRWNLQDWMVPHFKESLGEDAEPTAMALATRAPVTLRVNCTRSTVVQAQAALLSEGISTARNARAETALTVIEGAKRVRLSQAFADGLIELQDASSQAAVAGFQQAGRALDLCSGGGGKALALAAQGWAVTAHDIDPGRMRDLPARAARGGHRIDICPPENIGKAGHFDLVFCDAPCSGSGTWRRTPDAKWALTQDRLTALQQMQAGVLDAAVSHVAPGGVLAYATCSVLAVENAAQVAAFRARHPGWQVLSSCTWPVDKDGDGFFLACLQIA